MALVLADRVKETTTTAGTGTVTLLGASTGYQSFAVVGDGNTTYYTIAGQTTSEWEVGIAHTPCQAQLWLGQLCWQIVQLHNHQHLVLVQEQKMCLSRTRQNERSLAARATQRTMPRLT